MEKNLCKHNKYKRHNNKRAIQMNQGNNIDTKTSKPL